MGAWERGRKTFRHGDGGTRRRGEGNQNERLNDLAIERKNAISGEKTVPFRKALDSSFKPITDYRSLAHAFSLSLP
jgi:hypothetical protein